MTGTQLARRSAYEWQLRSMPSRGVLTLNYGGDQQRALQTLIQGDLGRGEHYVYLHRGVNDEVFYVGKGKGNRAYSRDRDELWHYYLKTRCNGHYEVEIVKYFETDEDALDFESDLIALFGERTVNAINTARKIDYEVNAMFHKLRKTNWANIAAAASLYESDPEQAENTLRIAIADMAEYARLNWEQGLFAELATEVFAGWNCHLNAQDLSALNKLTLLLKAQARWQDLIKTSDGFFEKYPETRQQGVAQQVLRRCEFARARAGSLTNIGDLPSIGIGANNIRSRYRTG